MVTFIKDCKFNQLFHPLSCICDTSVIHLHMDFIVDKQPNQETINAMQDALQSDNLETLYTDNIESLIEVLQ